MVSRVPAQFHQQALVIIVSNNYSNNRQRQDQVARTGFWRIKLDAHGKYMIGNIGVDVYLVIVSNPQTRNSNSRKSYQTNKPPGDFRLHKMDKSQQRATYVNKPCEFDKYELDSGSD